VPDAKEQCAPARCSLVSGGAAAAIAVTYVSMPARRRRPGSGHLTAPRQHSRATDDLPGFRAYSVLASPESTAIAARHERIGSRRPASARAIPGPPSEGRKAREARCA
jgi:hypothetical protein